MPELITDTYLTIANQSKGLFKEKGSKFLAFAFPVSSEQEIKEHLINLRKEFFDARHHCYAYRLGPEMKVFRSYDDDEPSGSAGKPILGQIIAHNLTNILIVVVRYFGGTLLGVGGLMHAYKNASADAIASSTILEKEIMDNLTIIFDFSLQNQVNRYIKDYNLKIVKSTFNYNCRIELQCRKKFTAVFIQKLKELLHIEIYLNENLLNQNI